MTKKKIVTICASEVGIITSKLLVKTDSKYQFNINKYQFKTRNQLFS